MRIGAQWLRLARAGDRAWRDSEVSPEPAALDARRGLLAAGLQHQRREVRRLRGPLSLALVPDPLPARGAQKRSDGCGRRMQRSTTAISSGLVVKLAC